MKPEDELIDRAGAVADGDAPGDRDESGPGANLARLHGLMRLFESQRAATVDPPFVWAEFEVEEVLGRGSFGTVYRARDPVLARGVALKLIDAAALDDAEFMAQALLGVAVDRARSDARRTDVDTYEIYLRGRA